MGRAFVLVPLYLYEYYGDGTWLRKHYEAMGRYVDYLTSETDDHILKHGLGDWFDIGSQDAGPRALSVARGDGHADLLLDALAMVKGRRSCSARRRMRSAGRSSADATHLLQREILP